MTFFVRKPAGLLAAGVMLWGLAAAAQAGDPPSPAQQPAPDAHSGAPAVSKPAKPDSMDRVICKDEEVTGSRLGGRQVCHTRRQWDEIENDSQQLLIEKKPH